MPRVVHFEIHADDPEVRGGILRRPFRLAVHQMGW